jgi:hypothetical protein
MKPPTLRVLTVATPLALAAVLGAAAQADASIGDAGLDNPHVLNHGATLRVTLESEVSNQAADDAAAQRVADSLAGNWLGGVIEYAIKNAPQHTPTTCTATANATDSDGAAGSATVAVPTGVTNTQIDLADQTAGAKFAAGDIEHLSVRLTCTDGANNSQSDTAVVARDAIAAG